MGVPKFYRWISERYPCLSEVVKEFQIPEFDNLYLDMNGIIHVCSHPEDDNPHFRITEEQIFKDIMYYLEFLFRMIKPRKVFFMAVDGCAPRAKMNQQRGRRFRSAREAEELERRAREKGEVLPTEKRFDSNCITPGTPFMARLQEQLKYFVVKKVSTDPLWRGVRVYLSGHETPGEGEHKIMDFIRCERSQPNYDPNTRHCLYGLDADLMMLGLTSHDPHFSLLREEVRFGGRKDKQKRPATPEETTFHLLHLSLFREYLDFEFSDLKEKLPFPYDLEKVIDDWVMMGFLVGNDFIPNLPHLHINHDALPLLWRTYIEILPSCGGYINEGGHLNLPRFEKYLKALAKFDFDTFSDQIGDLKWLEGKKAEKAETLDTARKLFNPTAVANKFDLLIDLVDGNGPEENGESPDLSEEPSAEISDEESGDTFEDEFRHHKRNYYIEKMDYEKVTPEVLRDQAEGYVRAIQWILLYYYEGVPSWSWFYPHHYAPYISDVVDFQHMNITFDRGTPFLPFEQLMAVLPAASKELLPEPLQSLMINDNSPVLDFYPTRFETDLNGKQQDWEAVVLIPFIVEQRLLDAMKPILNQLSPEEKSRNRHGPCLLYQYSPVSQGSYTSPLPDAFPDIEFNHAGLTEVGMFDFQLPSEQLLKGLLPNVRMDIFFPGFPTLKHVPHKATLKKEGVKVFQMNSRGYNMILQIIDESEPEVEAVAKQYLNKVIFVGWPHLYEAKVVEVSDDLVKYTLSDSGQTKGGKSKSSKKSLEKHDMKDNEPNIWHREVSSITERYHDRLGVEVGPTFVLLKALPMIGRKYVFGSHGRITTEKQFGNLSVPFLLHTTVKDIAVHDPDFCQYKTVEELFPEKCPVFMLGWPHYGCQGEVIEIENTENGRVRINITIPEEPDFSRIIYNQQEHELRYLPGYMVAQRVGISSQFLARITGSIMIRLGSPEEEKDKKINIGLNLKFTKRNEEVPGFTKMVNGQWMYSDKALDTVMKYIKEFPTVWEYISNGEKGFNDVFYESEVFPAGCGQNVKMMQDYIKTLPCHDVKTMKVGSDVLDEGIVEAIERQMIRIVETNKKRQKRIKMQVKPHLLYRPLVNQGTMVPDSTATYKLFDRVVNVRQGFPVPFGLRGTVVGIYPSEKEVDTMYEVIFDEEFQGGIKARCSTPKGYRCPQSSLINITYGERKNGMKPNNMIQQPSDEVGAGQNNKSRNVAMNMNYSSALKYNSFDQNHRNDMQYGAYNSYDRSQHNFGYHDNRGYNSVGFNYSDRGGYSQRSGNNRYGYQDSSRFGYHDNMGDYSDKRGYDSRGGYDNFGGTKKGPNVMTGGKQSGMKEERKERVHVEVTMDSSPQQLKPERLTGQVFNGRGASSPKFYTPKLPNTPTTSRQLSQDGLIIASEGTSNSEFANMWKELQSSSALSKSPSGGDRPGLIDQGTLLQQAAAALPKMPVMDSANEIQDSINNRTSASEIRDKNGNNSVSANERTEEQKRKIDVNNLFSQAEKAQVLPGNDEFTAMFKSLEVSQKGGGEAASFDKSPVKEAEEPTSVLKKMLHIDATDEQTSAEEKQKTTEPVTPGGSSKNYGRQLSVQELFEGVKQQKKSPPPPPVQVPEQSPPRPSQTKDSQKGQKLPQQSQSHPQQQPRPPLPQPAMGFAHNPLLPQHPPPGMPVFNQPPPNHPQYMQQQQQQRYPQQHSKRPNQLFPMQGGPPTPIRNPVMELLAFSERMNFGIPKYDHHKRKDLQYCIVTLGNGARFQGSPCKTKEEAADSAASMALLQMKVPPLQMTGLPFMRMPGYVMPGMMQYPPRQFSSPNSAFSPVQGQFQQRPHPGQGHRQGNYYQGQGQGQHRGNRPYHQSASQQPGGYPQTTNQQQIGGYPQTTSQQPGYSQSTNPQPGGYQQPTNQQPGSYSHNQSQTARQIQGRMQSTNQNVGDRTGQKEEVEKQAQNTDNKTPQTTAANPFIPLQVVKKQVTPQKGRKGSTSEDSVKENQENKAPPKLGKTEQNEEIKQKSHESVKTDTAVKVESTDTTAVKNKADANSKVETDSNKGGNQSQTPQQQQTSKAEVKSTGRPRRRLAANLNFGDAK